MELYERLKLPACGNWISIDAQKPQLFQYVLVNTQYCNYPAQTVIWNGFEFKSTDSGKLLNITHWAEINDLGQISDSLKTKNDIDILKDAIGCLNKSFEIIRYSKKKNENIEMIFESIGFQISNLIDELHKLEPPE